MVVKSLQLLLTKNFDNTSQYTMFDGMHKNPNYWRNQNMSCVLMTDS